MSQNKPTENKTEQIIGWIVGGLFFALIIFVWLSCTGNINCDSGPRGDGKNTCSNCGRKGVFAIGLCRNCSDGYVDWYNRTGGK